MHKSTHITDEETGALPGVSETSSRSTAWADTAQIIQFRPRTAAAEAWFDEEADEDHWEPVGLLALRIVGQFDRPRILVWSQSPGTQGEE